ncbi:MAG: hypothetical protein E4H03_03010 [Myxococcales bacterium]|nr:MAG: hypothetical protein E4H03_03010 [Myxococcales bacterium]
METVDLGTKFLVAGKKDRVLHVRIDRAEKRNALTQGMYRGLKRAAIIDADDAELDPTEHFPFRHFEQCRKVVVAAVNGLCHAGGLNLVMFSDVKRSTSPSPA